MKFNYKILQIRYGYRNPYMFMNWELACKCGFDINDYDEVYSNAINVEEKVIETLKVKEDIINYILEKLFYMFNIQCPDDFTGHSLSVSDIVELDGKRYYCNSCGWVEVQ